MSSIDYRQLRLHNGEIEIRERVSISYKNNGSQRDITFLKAK